MTKTIRTVVRPGGLIQVTDPEWTEGDTVEVRVSAAEPAPTPARPVPKLGTMKGTVLSMDRFDEPLEEFEGDM